MASVPAPTDRGMRLQRGFHDVHEARTARALGWFGVGLGIAQLLAPARFARTIGADGHRGWIRAVGAREIASGLGILGARRPARWLNARAGGDVIDLALRSPAARPLRLALAAAAVAGVGALDAASSVRAGRHPRAVPRQPARSGVVPVDEHVWINRAPAECYAAWSDVTRFPTFMAHVERVEAIDERRSRWIVRAPAGMRIEWTAEVLSREADRGIAWRSSAGSTVHHAGVVRFDPAPGGRGTIVRLRMLVNPPGGELGARLAGLFGASPMQSVREDLRRFKRLIETGEVPTTAGQPHGERSWIGRIAQKVNPT